MGRVALARLGGGGAGVPSSRLRMRSQLRSCPSRCAGTRVHSPSQRPAVQAHGQAAVGLVLDQLVGARDPRSPPSRRRTRPPGSRPGRPRTRAGGPRAHRERRCPRVGSESLRHGPAGQRAVALEPEVECSRRAECRCTTKTGGPPSPPAVRERLRRRRRVTLAPVLLELAGHSDGRYPPPGGASARTTARGASARPAARGRPPEGCSSPRRTPASPSSMTSGSASPRIATYAAVQGPTPGSASSSRREASRSAPGSDDELPRGQGRARGRAASPPRAARHRQVVGLGERRGVGKSRVIAPSGSGSGLAEAPRPAARRGCGRRSRTPAGRGPRAERARPRRPCPGTRRPGLAATSGASSGSPPSSASTAAGRRPGRAGDGTADGRARSRRSRGSAGTARRRRRGRSSTIAGPGGSRSVPAVARRRRPPRRRAPPGGQVRQQALAVEGPPDRQAQRQPAAGRRRRPPSAGPGPQLGRAQRVDLADRVVELAHAREAGRERDVRERQVGGLDQEPGGLRPLRPGERERPGAELGVS